MWDSLIFNSFWFGALFCAPFSRSKWLSVLALAGVFAAALITFNTPGVDPYAWLEYLAYSLIVLWSAKRFRDWSLSRALAFDHEIVSASHRLEHETRTLEAKLLETGALASKANAITYLYDKTKEMSQCLESLSAFLTLAEALSRDFHFRSIKLVLFNDEEPKAGLPLEAYGLRHSDFEGLFDKGAYLKNRQRVKTEIYPTDTELFERVIAEKKAIHRADLNTELDAAQPSEWPSAIAFSAFPSLIDGNVFAVLLLTDLAKKDLPMFSILVDRFAVEMRRVRLYERIQALAITDGLTDVFVRRHLLERLENELERSRRLSLKLSFLMIDIDHFKHFNDEYGHLVGDQVLKQVAETLRKNVRELDIVGRYGGEEFGVLLVETDESGALFVADRIRHAVEERKLKVYDETLNTTISIGVCSFSDKLNSSSVMIDAADSALYQAKREGRNKVCVFV